MKASEIIRSIVDNDGVKYVAVANRIGISKATLAMRMKQGTITTAKLNEILRVLDYKLVAVPRDARIPAEGFEVD